MATTKTTLKPGDNLPPRGQSNKTRILEACRLESFEDLTEDSTKDEAEIAFFRHVVRRAKAGEADKDSGMLLKLLVDKGWASLKPVMGAVEFEFDPEADEATQAKQILSALSRGHITPDVAQMIVGMMASMLKVEEVTGLKERVERMEQLLEQKGD